MKVNKCEKLVFNLYDKKKLCHIHKSFEAGTRSWSNTRSVHRVVEFNQEAWLRQYKDINTTIRTNTRNDFLNNFFKPMKKSVFGKSMENVKEAQEYQACNSLQKKRSSSFIT